MKLTERQKEDVWEYWQQTFDIFVASVPVEKLYQLKRKCEAGAVIRITPKRKVSK